MQMIPLYTFIFAVTMLGTTVLGLPSHPEAYGRPVRSLRAQSCKEILQQHKPFCCSFIRAQTSPAQEEHGGRRTTEVQTAEQAEWLKDELEACPQYVVQDACQAILTDSHFSCPSLHAQPVEAEAVKPSQVHCEDGECGQVKGSKTEAWLTYGLPHQQAFAVRAGSVTKRETYGERGL